MNDNITTDNNYRAHNSEFVSIIENIEDEIYYDLKKISTGIIYKKDCFKKNGHNIDIFSPREGIAGYKSVIIDPDTVRFMLSLYPYHNDFEKIRSILLQPRYIEINGIELVALYLAREKQLIIYLHRPFLYNSDDSRFNEYSKILSYALNNLSEEELQFNNSRAGKTGIPPLWYVLSTVTNSPKNKMEKFFVRIDNTVSNNILHKLSDVSFHYSRLGY